MAKLMPREPTYSKPHIGQDQSRTGSQSPDSKVEGWTSYTLLPAL